MVWGFKRSRDLERARLKPSSVFTRPEQVLEVPDLTRAERIEILRRWAYEADQPALAQEEEPPAGELMLTDRIQNALDLLESEAGDHP